MQTHSPLSSAASLLRALGKLTGPPAQPQATQPSPNPSAHWPQGGNGHCSRQYPVSLLTGHSERSWSGLPVFCIRMLPARSEEPLAVVRREVRDAARHGVTEQRWARGPANLMKQPRTPASPAQEQSGMMQKEPDIDWEAFILASLPAQVWKPGLVSQGQQLGTRTQKSTFSVHRGMRSHQNRLQPFGRKLRPLPAAAACYL